MDVRVGPQRKLSAKELMFLNCGVGEDSWDPLDNKEIKPVNLKGSQSWLFTGRTDVKLKLQYFGHLMRRTDSLEKTLMLGKIEGRRRRGRWRMRWLEGITNSMDMIWAISRSWWRTKRLGMLQSMGSQRVRHDWVNELNWVTEVNWFFCSYS